MPASSPNFTVTGGTLAQVDDTGDPAICYIDVNVPAGSTHVVTVEVDAAISAAEDLPASARLLGAHPNPFNPRTEISFELGQTLPCRLTIFDLKGREVAVLVDAELPPGIHSYFWLGADSTGLAMPSGMYFAGLKAGSYSETRKLSLVR
jgi:hypothetical protein